MLPPAIPATTGVPLAAIAGSVWTAGVLTAFGVWLCGGNACRKRFVPAPPIVSGRTHDAFQALASTTALPLVAADTSLEPGVFGILSPGAAVASRDRPAAGRCAGASGAGARTGARSPARQPHGRNAHGRRGRVLVPSDRLVDRRTARRRTRARMRRIRRPTRNRSGRLRREHPENVSVLRRVSAHVCAWSHGLESEEADRTDHVAPSRWQRELVGEGILDHGRNGNDRSARGHWSADDSSAPCRGGPVPRKQRATGSKSRT